MASQQELLKVVGLGKSYDGKRVALEDVSLTLNRGEFVTVIGASGAGKSTFLRCINRLIDPTEGSVVFDGVEVTALKKRELKSVRRRISMIFQHYNLVYRATAIENVLQGRLGYKNDFEGLFGLYSEEEKKRAFELLDAVGLADFAYLSAVVGSRTVGAGPVAAAIVRGIASLFRNIPVVAWAFILLFSFHQSEFTGFLALFLGSYGYLTRCFLESVEEVSEGTIEAVRSTGASRVQLIANAVIPLSITSVISWTLYMVETNIRDATLVGILTGTGIGFVFNLFYKSFRYDVAGLVILLIVVAVIACEALSNYVRRRII